MKAIPTPLQQLPSCRLPMQQQRSAFRAILTVVGLAAVGMLISVVAQAAPAPVGATDDAPFWSYVLMAIIAVSGAVRMVTHTKPVYAALCFIPGHPGQRHHVPASAG